MVSYCLYNEHKVGGLLLFIQCAQDGWSLTVYTMSTRWVVSYWHELCEACLKQVLIISNIGLR